MWWQYLIMALVSISAALTAVRFDHWRTGRNEYRKARVSVKHEIAANISNSGLTCGLIDDDLNFHKEGKVSYTPYFPFHDLAWSTWKSVILLRNPELADKIDEAYFFIPIVNNLLPSSP
jgi:hypothetical protein